MRPIVAVAGQELEDRSDQPVNVWRKLSARGTAQRHNPIDFFQSGPDQSLVAQAKRVVASAKSTLMVSCNDLGHDFAEDLVAAAGRGVRVYLLLSESGFKSWLERPLDQLPDLCLCRRSSHGIPTMILADAEKGSSSPTDGMLLSPGAPLNVALTEGGGLWGLALSSLQIGKLAELFSWLFWTSIGDRSETRALAQLQSPVAAQAPEGAVLRPFANDRVVEIGAGTGESLIWHGLESSVGFVSCGLTANALREFLGQDMRAKLDRAYLPSCEEINTKGQVLAGGCPGDLIFMTDSEGKAGWLFDWIADPELLAAHSTVLRLTNRQAAAFSAEFKSLVQDAEYVLARHIPTGDLESGEAVLRYPGAERVTVEGERVIDLGSVRVDPWWNGQLETYSLPISRRPEVNGIVQRVKWVWRNEAAAVPESARLSPDEIKMKDVQTAAAAAFRQILQEQEKLDQAASLDLQELKRAFGESDSPVRKPSELCRVLELLETAKAEVAELAKAGGEQSELSAVRGKKRKGKIKIPNPDHLPANDLPAAGRLFWNSGDFIVVVDDWDDVPVAAKEAERWNAALCVPRKSKSQNKGETSGGQNA